MDIKLLLQEMSSLNASDLHLVAGQPPVFRINQELKPAGKEKLDSDTIQKMVYPMLRDTQIKKFEDEKELDLGYEVGQSRFRINLHYERGKIGCAIRRIPRHIPSRQQLRLPEIIDRFCNDTRGLILVTGPTGSGKSTTQACMIDKINSSRPCHIITIEDPIEYVHDHRVALIEQREVGIDTNSFADALKRVLRQDPDVILLGEMRDLETIQFALTAAETGHLVISTLHTADAPQSIDRIIDVFPPHQQAQVRLQLSMTLKVIIAQQLLPTKGGRGVIPAIEVLIANPAIRNIIRKSSTQEIYSMVEIGKAEGMRSMDAALVDLYRTGQIEKDTALNYAINQSRVKREIT